jgi:hypothetical protein
VSLSLFASDSDHYSLLLFHYFIISQGHGETQTLRSKRGPGTGHYETINILSSSIERAIHGERSTGPWPWVEAAIIIILIIQ